MSSSTGTYDTRRYPLCPPWSGQRGNEFTKVFLPAFRSGLMAKSDDFCTFEQHIAGECPGGIVPPSATQLANNLDHVNAERPHPGNAAEQRKSEAAFYSRDLAIVSYLRGHVLNPLVQRRIDDIVAKYRDSDYLAGAPILHPALPAGAPPNYPADHLQAGQPLSRLDLQNYQRCGNSLARHVLRIIREEATPDPTSGITRMTLENRWSNLKLSEVGITDTTPRDLSAYLTDLAAEARYNEEAKVTKFLSLLTYPADIATKATQELHRCSKHLRNADGRPDFLMISREMQELWTVCCQQGQVTYKPKVTSRPQTLDGMSLNCADDDDDEAVYQAAVLGGGGSSVTGEAMCWNCLGFGHTKNKDGVPICPSPRRARSITDAVDVLKSKATQQNRGRPVSRGRGGDAAGRGGRGGASRGRGTQRQPPQVNALDDDSSDSNSNNSPANVNNDGNVFAVDGTLLKKIGERSTSDQEDKTPEEFEDAAADRFEMGDFGSTTLGGHALFSLELLKENMSELSNDPASPSPDASPPDASPPLDAADTAAGRSLKKASPFSCLAPILLTVANASAALARAVNDNRGAAVIATATSFAQGADGFPACSSSACTLALNAFGADNASVTWDANIDSGCSVTASGRVGLFPKKLISEWHPNIQVRSASLQKMSVLFLGSMILVPYSVPNKKKKKQGLVVKDALCVPAMKTLTLISPKQLTLPVQ